MYVPRELCKYNVSETVPSMKFDDSDLIISVKNPKSLRAMSIACQPMSNSTFLSGSFFPVTRDLYLALFDADQAKRMAQHSLKVKYIVVPMAAMCRCTKEDDLANTFTPSSLIEIYKFDAMANQIKRQNSGQKLIFASGRNVSVQRRATFLIGCHVIMSHGLDADTTFSMLENINAVQRTEVCT